MQVLCECSTSSPLIAAQKHSAGIPWVSRRGRAAVRRPAAPQRRPESGRRAPRASASGSDEPRSGGYKPFPFSQDAYYRVALQLVQGNMVGMVQGFLLLMREDETGTIVDNERGLVVAVGGDTLAGIALLAQGRRAGERPLALDLLWQVLSRGREVSKVDWTLQRVAIVGMKGSTYLGRLWFGSDENTILWDCDARPSDSIWLALKSSCPIYCRRDVWDTHATPLEELQSSEDRQQAVAAQAAQEEANADPMAIRPSDPEVIKRFKSELRVLISDENYEQAARLRDHPLMSLYLERTRALDRGDTETAKDLDRRLQDAIAAFEAGESI